MKKIVHIISGLQVGGAERSLFNICNSSLNDSFKQYVICLGNRGYYSQKIEEIGLEIYHINFSSWHFFKSLISSSVPFMIAEITSPGIKCLLRPIVEESIMF